DLDLRLAALGSDSQNLKLVGQVGPLTSAGKIDAAALPLDLKLTAGPVAMAAIRESSLGKSIPPKLEVSDAVSIEATLKGRLDALRIHADTNLSSNKIAFGDSFQKASGDTLKVSADADRSGSAINISLAQIALGDLETKATRIKFGGGQYSGRLDTNRFDIASVTQF